ncbi:MAG: DUF952 domain-containing protein [Oscillochloris sp.]|nr:DUF952 domain-containing protein [Oscillochloris sp.]
MIYHIAEHAVWAATAESYRPPSLEREGFIHLSTNKQVLRTAARFYCGRTDLLLLAVDPGALQAEMRYEEAEPGEFFPHLYGPLNLDAIVAVLEFQPEPDGTFRMP